MLKCNHPRRARRFAKWANSDRNTFDVALGMSIPRAKTPSWGEASTPNIETDSWKGIKSWVLISARIGSNGEKQHGAKCEFFVVNLGGLWN